MNSMNGYKYLVYFIYYFSRITWLYLMKNKEWGVLIIAKIFIGLFRLNMGRY
jgi:hypothetical protein